MGLQEAKDSSAVENIITTHDDLYKSGLSPERYKSLEAKEVQNYISALRKGFELVLESGALTLNTILKIQEVLEGNSAGFRKLPEPPLKMKLPAKFSILLRRITKKFSVTCRTWRNSSTILKCRIVIR